MINSIQHFEEIGIRKLEKVIENFLKNPKDMASFVAGIETEIINLGLGIIQETLENCDTMIRDSGKRKQETGQVSAPESADRPSKTKFMH